MAMLSKQIILSRKSTSTEHQSVVLNSSPTLLGHAPVPVLDGLHEVGLGPGDVQWKAHASGVLIAGLVPSIAPAHPVHKIIFN